MNHRVNGEHGIDRSAPDSTRPEKKHGRARFLTSVNKTTNYRCPLSTGWTVSLSLPYPTYPLDDEHDSGPDCSDVGKFCSNPVPI
jgi:hypothetical protein